jgi:hypothetical protein
MSDDSMSDDSDSSRAPTPAPRSNADGSGADDSGPNSLGVNADSSEAVTQRSRENPAISDDTVQRYYYVYDSRAGRPLVQDRLTQAPYVWDDDPRAPVLRYAASSEPGAEKRGGERPRGVDRRFALWCARQVTDALRSQAEQGDTPSSTSTVTDELIRAAEALVETPESKRAKSVRGTAENAVIHASTIGLSEMDPSAAALLTAFGATHSDPRTAALEAAHMSERYAEFVAYHRHNGTDTPLPAAVRQRYDRLPGARGDTPVPDAAARLMREAHIDWLLEESAER